MHITAIRRQLGAALLLLSLLAPPAQGQSVYQLVATGQDEAARKALTAQVGHLPEAPIHFAFLDALILIRQGQADKATRLLRDILERAPQFEPARRELSVLLARTGQTEGALYHAETLLATTSDPVLRQQLEGFLATQGRGKPRGITTRAGILPSTNANGGTEEETVIIGGLPFVVDEASRAQAAVGLSFGATAWNRWQMGESLDATLSGSIDAKIYDDDFVPDETVARLALDLARNTPRYRLTFGPLAELTYHDGQRYLTALGAGIAGEYLLRPDLRLGGGLTYRHQDYAEDDFQDGFKVSGQATMRWILSPQSVLSASLPFEVERTDRPHLDHRDIGLTLGLEHSWQNGLTTGLSLGYTDSRYRGNFPLLDAPRHDRETTLGISARHRNIRFGAFVPQLSLTYTKSGSNVAFFDYDKIDVGMTLTQRF